MNRLRRRVVSSWVGRNIKTAAHTTQHRQYTQLSAASHNHSNSEFSTPSAPRSREHTHKHTHKHTNRKQQPPQLLGSTQLATAALLRIESARQAARILPFAVSRVVFLSNDRHIVSSTFLFVRNETTLRLCVCWLITLGLCAYTEIHCGTQHTHTQHTL